MSMVVSVLDVHRAVVPVIMRGRLDENDSARDGQPEEERGG